MSDVLIEAGDLLANRQDRIVSGLLLPYGEEGRTNLGRLTVDPGTITLPTDPANTVGINRDHKQLYPLGRAVTLQDTRAGVFAAFKIADGPEGDTALADIESGKAKKLSVELRDVVIRAGHTVSGVLTGAALLAKGAFPSAALMAADTEDDTAPTEGDEKTTVPETPEPNSDTESEESEEEGDMPDATIPDALLAQRAPAKPQPMSFAQFIQAYADRAAGRVQRGDLLAALHSEVEGAGDLFAALSDIKISGANQVGTAIVQPQFIGELWDGRSFERHIIPLFGTAPLTALTINAWKWGTKPAVAPWAGNKAAVTSNAPTTTAYTVTANRLAGAHDVAREFRDFTVPGFWEGYYRAMTDSYAKLSDAGVLTDITAAATAVASSETTVTGMGAILDGVFAIIAEAVPTFAILSTNLYRDLLTTPHSDAMEYLSSALGIEGGTTLGFKVIPDATLAAGTALVGSKQAATVYELPGAPIRVEGLNVANGGIDPAVFGYYATVIHDSAAIAKVAKV